MKILVLHGPNTHLIGLQNPNRITLDKINNTIKKEFKKKGIQAKIFQTNSESRAINIISQNRNKCDGILITPTSWSQNGYGINDLLQIIQKPYVCVSSINNKSTLFKSALNYIDNKPIIKSYKKAAIILGEEIQNN